MFKNWHVIFSDWLLQDKRSLDLAVGAWKRLAWPRGRLAVHPSSWSLGKIPMVQGTASPFCWHICMSSQYMDMYIYICDIYIYVIYDIWNSAVFWGLDLARLLEGRIQVDYMRQRLCSRMKAETFSFWKPKERCLFMCRTEIEYIYSYIYTLYTNCC